MVDDLRDTSVKNFLLMSGDKDFLFMIERIIHEGRSVDVIGPRFATCYEYKTMDGFIELESVPGIQLDESLTARKVQSISISGGF